MDSPQIVMEILEQIADHEGVDPVELDVPLYDVIDPDALKTLINGTRDRQRESMLRVEFIYYGYAVTVGRDGRVLINEQRSGPDTDESSEGRSGAA